MSLLAVLDIIPWGVSNSTLVSSNGLAGVLSRPCGEIYYVLSIFTVVLAFVGLIQAAYKVQMGGDLTGLGTQLIMTVLAAVSLAYIPIWILNAEITLGPMLLEDLGCDVKGVYDHFLTQLGDDVLDSIPGIIADILLGFFFLGLQFLAVISEIILIIAFVFAAIIYGAIIIGYLVQVAVVYLAISISPIFLGMLMFERTRETGYKYFIGIVGILFWQLGWGMGYKMVGATFDALHNMLHDNGALTAINVFCGGIISAAFALLECFLMWAVLTKAPKIMSEAIVSGSQVGTGLVSAGAGAITSAVSSAVSAGSQVAMIAATAGTGGAAAPAMAAGAGAKGGGAALGAATKGLEG